MKAEKIVLSFIALLAGLLVAGIAFYLYQSTKTIPQATQIITPKNIIAQSSPIPKSPVLLIIESPIDESVVEVKTLVVAGKTSPDATVIVSTDAQDEVVSPAANGNFSTSIPIGDGENVIEITAISPSGQKTTITKTVTYSTESF